MKLIRKLAACLTAMLLFVGLPVQAEQLDYIDLDHSASLRFEVHTPQGDPVPGGERPQVWKPELLRHGVAGFV